VAEAAGAAAGVLVLDPVSAVGVVAEAAGADAEVPVAAVGVAVEVAEAAVDAAEVTAELAVDAAEVTAEVADVVAEAAGAAAEVLVRPVGVVAEAAGAAAEVLVPDPVPVVTGPERTADTVAAWACRENASKMTRIPAATIATCTARQAMRRKIGCGMSSSRTTGKDRGKPDPTPAAHHQQPQTRGAHLFRPISLWSPGTGDSRSVHQCTYCSVTTVHNQLRSGKGLADVE
jgi:hypothetical protein